MDLQESCSQSWFVAVESQTGETLDVADVRSGPIDGIEHVKVVPRSEAEALADHLLALYRVWCSGDENAGPRALRAAIAAHAEYRARHPKETP